MKAQLLIKGHIGKPEMDFFSLFEDEPLEAFSEVDMAVFLAANKNATEIEITIESGGGFVEEGFNIYNMLLDSGKQVTTIAKQADSIASVIFLAGSIRKVYASAEPVIHFPFIENLFVERATSEELDQINKAIKQLESQIVNVYVNRTGADASYLEAIMQKNAPITAQQFKALGFATEIIETSEKVMHLPALAYIKALNLNNNKNTMKTEDVKSWFAKIENMIAAIGKKVKNLNVPLKDGTIAFISTEQEEAAVGDAVFSDEAMTVPAADGSYETESGQIIEVAGGVILSILPAVMTEDLEALKTENANLKAELEALKASSTEATNKVVELTATVENFNKAKASSDKKFTDIKKELEDFKALVLDSSDKREVVVSKAAEGLAERRKLRSLLPS